MAAFLLVQAFSFLFLREGGKLNHRDYMLSLHAWRGDERVLDVGCGRGLLLAGAARKLRTGHATGLDIWSNVDMGGTRQRPPSATWSLRAWLQGAIW